MYLSLYRLRTHVPKYSKEGRGVMVFNATFNNISSLRANPLTRSPEQVKLDSDKLKL